MARYDRGYGGGQGAPRGWSGRPGGYEEGYDGDFGGYEWMRYGRWDAPGMRGAQGRGGYPGERGGSTFGGGRQGGYGGEMERGGGWFGGGRYAGGGFGYGGAQYGRERGGWGEGWGGGYDAYDRGIYGESYPGPAWREQGGGGYGGDRPSRGRGYDGGYGGGPARAPFMPEEAYRRHPEYDQPRQERHWEGYHSEFGEDLSDEEILDAVCRRMQNDAWLDPDRIEVRVEDGVVTLTGEVDDFLEARYAWDDAWEAQGVRGVVNNLTVRTDQPTETHGDVVAQSSGERPEVEAGEAGS